MSIHRRLSLIILATILFAIMAIAAVHQTSKGARFHQLNSLQLKYTINLRNHLIDWDTPNVDLEEVEQTIKLIRAQPSACLKNINDFDLFIMKKIGTAQAAQFCKDDIRTANQALETIQKYKTGQVSFLDLKTQLTTAAKKFWDNSSGLEVTIARTVDFIAISSIITIILFAIIVIFTIAKMARNIVITIENKEQVEQDLLESEHRFRDFSEASAEWLWEMDRDLRFTYISKKFEALTGKPTEAYLGKTRREIIGKDIIRKDPDKWDAHFKVLETRQAFRNFEYEVQLENDAHVDVSISALPKFDHDGHFQGYRGSGRNISAKIHAKNKLLYAIQKSEEITKELSLHKFAIDEHAIVSIADIQGNITYANQKFCKISKYELDELIGQNHRLIKSGEHPRSFFKDMWKTISHGNVWQGEVKNKDKNGGYYWVMSTIVPTLNDMASP